MNIGRKWLELTKLERWLLVISAMLASIIIGLLVNRAPVFQGLEWDGISAIGTAAGGIVATIAVIFGIFGYLDTRQAQRLEHRAYLNIDINNVIFENNGCARIELVLNNYGRTPARAVAVTCHAAVVFSDGEKANLNWRSLRSI